MENLKQKTRVYVEVKRSDWNNKLESIGLIIATPTPPDLIQLAEEGYHYKGLLIDDINRGMSVIHHSDIFYQYGTYRFSIVAKQADRISLIVPWFLGMEDIVFIGDLPMLSVITLWEMFFNGSDGDIKLTNIHQAKFIDIDLFKQLIQVGNKLAGIKGELITTGKSYPRVWDTIVSNTIYCEDHIRAVGNCA